MQVQVLTTKDISRSRSLFQAMHEQRHEVFAVQLGWTDLRSRTGREYDQFDTEDATYLIAEDHGQVHGSLRLLPAARRSMLAECWPSCLSPDAAPFDVTTWEWTRWCPGVTSRPRELLAARRALILAAIDVAQMRGGRRFVTFCDAKFVTQLEALGWTPRTLGQRWRYPQGEAVGVAWEIGLDARHRIAARLPQPRARTSVPVALPLAA